MKNITITYYIEYVMQFISNLNKIFTTKIILLNWNSAKDI